MANRFDIIASPILGLTTLERKPIGDSRGYLERVFCETELSDLIAGRRIVQMNRTLTKKVGVVRGMHYQRPPSAETKIVSCTRGEIFDVAIDLRKGSPTFLQWYGEVLSAENHRTLFIPEGFAHGYQTLSEDVELLYLHTAAHSSDHEEGLNALDPLVGIKWPREITDRSPRDANLQYLSDDFKGIEL